MNVKEQYIGLFLGTAVGDAIGLPREGLPPNSACRILGDKVQPAFIVIPFVKRLTICSDDTEHLWLTAQALLETQSQSVGAFEQSMAHLLKKWLLSLPVGTGMATLKASFKLLLGISPQKSGVFSAGNGPVMRAPIIGAFYANDKAKMEEILKTSTVMTHSDPKAYEAAWVVASATTLIMNNHFDQAPIAMFFNTVMANIKGEELSDYLSLAQQYLANNCSLAEYLEALSLHNKGISGYVNHTVPAVIYAWLRYFNDYEETVSQLIVAGGDTDTTAAIAGALAGVTTGKDGIPIEWLNSVVNHPLTIVKLEQMAQALSTHDQEALPKVSFILLGMRNVLSFAVILVYGFNRLWQQLWHTASNVIVYLYRSFKP